MQWLSYQAQGAAVPSQPELRKGRNGLSVQPEGLGYARVGMLSQQALAGMVPSSRGLERNRLSYIQQENRQV